MKIEIDFKDKIKRKEIIHKFLESMNTFFNKNGVPFPILWEDPRFGDGFIDDMFFLSTDDIKKNFGTSYNFILKNLDSFKKAEPKEYDSMIYSLEEIKKQLLEFAKVDFSYEIL